jgi:hypothetical protein
VAVNQIATLKKHAAQLQSFKKNISNMIQVVHPGDNPGAKIWFL